MEELSEEYRELGSQVLTITGIFCAGIFSFTLAMDIYRVLPSAGLVAPGAAQTRCRVSLRMGLETRVHRLVSFANKRGKVPKLIALTAFQSTAATF